MNRSNPPVTALETERKWLVETSNIPKDQILSSESIKQGYLEITPDREVRIRAKGNQFFHTIKESLKGSDTALNRQETEKEITAEEFYRLWPQTEGRRLEKVRHIINLADNLKAELDVFTGSNKGLIMVEVEFPNELASRNFKSPDWFGQEVTKDKSYKNQNLAK